MSMNEQNSLYRLGEQLIEKRTTVLLIITVITLVFAVFAVRLDMVTRFDELLPQTHPFIQVHNQYAPTFGGANTVSIMLEVKEGSIFTKTTLTKIFEMTQRIDKLHGVNHELVNSLAHRTNRRVRMLSGGMQVVDPVMATAPKNDQEVNTIRQIVHSSRNLYGVIVSLDEKATLITATFIEGRLDHRQLFADITGSIIEPFQDENTLIYVTGEPWKYGWVYHYAKEVFLIFLGTAVLMWVLLYWYFRDIRGALRPTITGVISAIWGLGFIKMVGFSLDPLTMVIPFFVTARAVSHSVQMHDRYYEEYKKANWQKRPAIVASFAELFAPTLSGILTDALGLLVILLVPIVLLQKLAISAAVWIMAITVSELLLNPIVYFYLREPDVRVVEARERGAFKRIIFAAADILLTPAGKVCTFLFWGAVLASSIYYWKDLVIGDPTSAEPLLRRDSEYNVAHARIQEVFGGSEPLMIVVERQGSNQQNSVAMPEVLRTIEKLQRHMERDPSVSFSFSFVDILPVVNAAIHDTETKWEVLPWTASQVNLLLAAYFSGNSYQDTNRFIDAKLRAAPIWFYCTDHKGENIRRIIQHAKTFIEAHPLQPARFLLAGGRLGVLAAANDELLKNDIMVNVLGFATIFLVLVVTYRSVMAGMYMLIPLLIANAVVNAYMGARNIGININTLPVVTVGVGFGIDYGLYLVSRIVEEYRTGASLAEAVRLAVATSGKSVSFTALTMIMGTLFWTFSHIRFNAEMGLLLALWMGISFLTTMTLLPVMVAVLQPRFILRERAA